jgi:hypothetical protein
MLARTLLKSGHSEVAHHSGHAAHGHAAKKIIPGTAGYMARTDLGWVHGHHELNYRKTSLGFKAYNKDNMDIWAPFANKLPFRHMETSAPGMWFAGGTPAVHHWGFLKWPLNSKVVTTWFTAIPFAYLGYRMRWAKGGYTQKNMGAVFGVQ